MRITLEAADLIEILEKHLEATLDPTNVTIRTDPFEVEISGVPFRPAEEPRPPLTDTRYREPEEEKIRSSANVLKGPPPPSNDDRDFSPHDFINASRRLAAELDAERQQTAGDNE